jgi:bifunctional DNA-binding transcriptional regulator/antitoxin component of YhaV-PrlF toxin-antitoxin module
VPDQVRRRAGLKHGDQVEFKVSGGVINIVPKLPSADGEYTPAERRLIDARLQEARKGPYYGPFATAHEAITFLRKEIRSRKAAKRKTNQAMEIVLSDRAIEALTDAPPAVRRAFGWLGGLWQEWSFGQFGDGRRVSAPESH